LELKSKKEKIQHEKCQYGIYDMLPSLHLIWFGI